MQQVLNISFRNLVRQKRRNILLGSAIAFGALVLVLTNSFSHGITKVLFEQIVKYTAGHVSISYMRNGNMMSQIFYDDCRIRDAIKKAAPETTRSEEAVGIFGRAIGNGVADNVILVGVDLSGQLSPKELKEFQANFKMLHGSFLDLNDKSKGMPVVLAEQKAKYLKVQMGDIIRVRFIGVSNQASSAQLVVAGIFKPANIFMSSPIFLEIQDVRKLAGYGPHDIAALHLTIRDPQHTAKKAADRIHDALKPGLAAIEGSATFNKAHAAVLTLGIRTDSASLVTLRSALRLESGDSAKTFSYQGVVIAKALAVTLKAGTGDTIAVAWKGKYDTAGGRMTCVISGIASPAAKLPANALFVNERDFYRAYYNPLPPAASQIAAKQLPDSSNPFWQVLAPEYLLMKRCATTDEFVKMQTEMTRGRFKGVMVNVQSMYETASAVLQLETALNLITFVAGMVLFFIILIGVVNTLRMTIRERTREIGTVRAIGMQKGDVTMMFILETALLALFASLIGAVGAFLAMWGLHSISIEPGENPLGLLLVNNHLFFAPTIPATIFYIALIVAIAVGTAWLPARRASNLSAANAMRHYE